MSDLWNSTVRVPVADDSQLFLIALVDGEVVTHILPAADEITIGRAEQCDVVIVHRSVSRQHVRVRLIEPFTVTDLDSANGTTVREKKIGKNHPISISRNEVFVVGDVSLVLQRRPHSMRSRRVWSHDYFEGRVSEGCARVSKGGAPFGVLHLTMRSGEAQSEVLESHLMDHLDELDVLARFGPRDYEILVNDVGTIDVLSEKLAATLRALSIPVRIGSASCPRNGRDADKLLAVARNSAAALVTGAGSPGVVLEDEAMRNLYQLAKRVALGSIHVLILGETGVGKQVLAETIHKHSPRKDRALVQLNCSAFSETLLESELFGHEKGAFTGAVQAKVGLLESANGGSVFLDEVGDMPLSLQAKLLRAIENQEVLPVGSLKPRKIDVRFIAATNRDLEADVRAGRFRQDLLFRINGVTLHVPPLRERPAEIASLARSFIAEYSKALAQQQLEIADSALERLRSYSWPGNIRELRNMMERAVLLCSGDVITLEHLPMEKLQTTYSKLTPSAQGTAVTAAPPGNEADPDKQRVVDAFLACGGNHTEAAKMLGVSRRSFAKLLEHHGMARPRKQRPTDTSR